MAGAEDAYQPSLAERKRQAKAGNPLATALLGGIAANQLSGAEVQALKEGGATVLKSGLGGASPTTGVFQGAAPGMFDLEGIGAEGNVILPAAGALGLYDLYKKQKQGLGGAAQGAAAGAAVGSMFGGVGAVPGYAIGAGLGALYGGLHKKSMTEVEDKRHNALMKAGVAGFDQPFKEESYVDKGQLQNKDAAKDAMGYDAAGNWFNNKFSQTRNERDMGYGDLKDRAAFGETFGDAWNSAPEQAKQEIIHDIVVNGSLREHHGTVDLNLSPEKQKEYAAKLTGPVASTNTGGNQSSSVSVSQRKPLNLPKLKKKKPGDYMIDLPVWTPISMPIVDD